MFKRGSIVLAAALLACSAAHATDKSKSSSSFHPSPKIFVTKLAAFFTKLKEEHKHHKHFVKHHPKPVSRC